MNKELLDQVQQALKSQQDTIQRQNQMLDSRDRDIAHLQSLLEQLTTTQTEQLQRLPTLYKQLQNTISEQRKAYTGWISQRKTLLELMNKLTSDSITLSNVQIQLTETLKSYQSTTALESNLSNDTEQLESKLDKLANSQSKIISSQESLKEQQQNLLGLLTE